MHVELNGPTEDRTLYKLLVSMAEAGSIRTAAAVLVALAEREAPDTPAHARLVRALSELSPDFASAGNAPS